MLSNVHWNLGVSDFLFTDFADALLEAFRTWGSRGDLVLNSTDQSPHKRAFILKPGDSAMAEIQASDLYRQKESGEG